MASWFSALTLLAFCLVRLCWATDVVVDLNSTRLVTSPPGLWSGADLFDTSCKNVRWFNTSGHSVSLNFTGSQIRVEFLLDRVGRAAQITLDGVDLSTQVNTFGDGVLVLNGDCRLLPWTSPNLTPGDHTIKVTALDPDPRVPASLGGWLDFHGFIYTDTLITVPSSNTPSPTIAASSTAAPSVAATTVTFTSATANSSFPVSEGVLRSAIRTHAIIGGTIGGAAAVLIIVVVILRLRRHPTQKLNRSNANHGGLLTVEQPRSPDTTLGPYLTPLDISPENSPRLERGNQLTAPVVTPYPLDLHGTGGSDVDGQPSPRKSGSTSKSRLVQPQTPLPTSRQRIHTPTSSMTTLLPPDARLSQNQLDLLQRLADSDTPGPALAAVVESMLRQSGSGVPSEVSDITSRLGHEAAQRDLRTLPPPPPSYMS